METSNLDLTQSFPKGRRTLLFIEKDYFVFADATFSGSEITIEHLERHQLANALSETDIHTGLGEIIDRIKSQKALPPKLVVSLPSFLFDINIFTMPKTKNSLVDLLVRDKLNTAEKKLYYRYSILGETGEKDSALLTVLACSIESSFVSDFFYQFEKAGLRSVCMSHATVGLIELLNARLKDMPEDLVILVDTVSKPISVCIYTGGRLSQLRILHNLECGEYQEFVRNITVEMKRTILFCKQTYSGKIVDRILYLGDRTGEFEKVAEDVFRNINFPITNIEFDKINYPPDAVPDVSLEKYLPSLCGLHMMNASLAGIVGKRNKFNFISSHSKSKALIGLLIALLLFVSAFVINFKSSLADRIMEYESDLVQLESEKSRFNDIKKIEKEVETLDRCYDEYRGIMGDIDAGSESLSWLTLVIVECLPESSHIVSITLKENDANSATARSFFAVIRDDFSGSSSLSLEKSIARLKETKLFEKVDYKLLGSSNRNPAERALEEARLEICF